MKRSIFTAAAIIVVSFMGIRPVDGIIPYTTDIFAATSDVVIRSVGNELKFALTEFTVTAGEEVHLVFENTATVQGMSHNVVIVDSEEAIDRVGLAAISAAATDYIPNDKSILFFTPLAAAGESVEVTFTAPEPGTYYYTCTFPGHFVLMRGVMTVE